LRSRNTTDDQLPSILRIANVHYRVHTSPTLVPVLSQINTVHTIPSYLFKIYFNTVYPPTTRSSKWSLIRATCLAHLILLDLTDPLSVYINEVGIKMWNFKRRPTPCRVVSCSGNYPLRILCPQNSQPSEVYSNTEMYTATRSWNRAEPLADRVDFVPWQRACLRCPLNDGLAKQHVEQLDHPLYWPYLVTCDIHSYTTNILLDCDSFWVSGGDIQRNPFRHSHTSKYIRPWFLKMWVVTYSKRVSPTSQEWFKT
jgi:hypothetical protein